VRQHGKKMLRRPREHEPRWCIIEGRDTDDRVVPTTFKTREEAEREKRRLENAEKDRCRLEGLPEQAGRYYSVTTRPEDSKRPTGRTSSRRAGR
jgi:hypothetical protein